MLKNTLAQKPSLKLNLKINKRTINSIKVLQMSIVELTEFTKEEIDKNPLLSLRKNNKNFDSEYIDNYTDPSNLKSWLYQQSFSILEKKYTKLITIYIENLDDNGFCRISPSEAAFLSSDSTESAILVLKKLKDLDPVGIFSQSLEENLKIQLIKKNIYNKSYEIILNNLKFVASHNIDKLMKLSKLSNYEIKNIIKTIKSLKPKPIDSLRREQPQLAIPDIIVKKNNTNKKLKIILNQDQNFKIVIDKNYEKKLKNRKNDPMTKKYINDCVSHGKWLQNALDRRGKTIMYVSKKIIEYQKNYFFENPEKILPLTLKEVSNMCDYHETTIGRTIKNKFLLYENAVFPLKNLFSTKILNKKNNNISATSIKIKIKKLLSNENIKKTSYSDQKIVEIFSKDGVIISRRTIAKYRQNMNIPSSIVRSRLEKL